MIDIDNINTRKEFRHWFDRNFGKRTTIKFEPIYDIFKMAKQYRKEQMTNSTETPQQVADRIRQQNIAWGGAVVLVIVLLGVLAYAF